MEAEPAGGPARLRLAQVSRGSMAIAGLFAAGVVCMYLLSPSNKPEPALAAQATIELEVDSALSRLNSKQLTGSDSQRAAEIVSSFHSHLKERQVPLGHLRRNPFVFELFERFDTQTPKAQPATSTDGVPPELAQPLKTAKQLQLQAVLVGSEGVTAVISGNLVTEGQQLGGWTVSKIGPRKVILTLEGYTYVLELPE